MSMYRSIISSLFLSVAIAWSPLAPSIAVGSEVKLAASEKKKTKKVVKKKKKKESSQSELTFWHFLPFGAGQFYQGKNILGGTFAVSEVMMLYLYTDRQKQIDLSNSDASATIAEVEAAGGEPDQETLDYLSANESYVKKAQQQQKLALIGFFGLYALGVAEAVFDPFGLNPPKKTALHEDDSDEKWEQSRDLSSPRLGFFVLPGREKGETYGFNLVKPFH